MFDKNILIETLELQIKTIPSLKEYSRHNIYFKIWWEKTKYTLEQLYGLKSETVKKFVSIRFSHRKLNSSRQSDTKKVREAYFAGLHEAHILLREIINQLKDENQ